MLAKMQDAGEPGILFRCACGWEKWVPVWFRDDVIGQHKRGTPTTERKPDEHLWSEVRNGFPCPKCNPTTPPGDP